MRVDDCFQFMLLWRTASAASQHSGLSTPCCFCLICGWIRLWHCSQLAKDMVIWLLLLHLLLLLYKLHVIDL
jgi:hypothetical protein